MLNEITHERDDYTVAVEGALEHSFTTVLGDIMSTIGYQTCVKDNRDQKPEFPLHSYSVTILMSRTLRFYCILVLCYSVITKDTVTIGL